MVENSDKYMSLFSPIQARVFKAVQMAMSSKNLSGESFAQAVDYSVSVQTEIAADFVCITNTSSDIHQIFLLFEV